MNSLNRMRRSWILFSLSVITPRMKFVRSGPVSLRLRIGAYPTLLPSKGAMRSSARLFLSPSMSSVESYWLVRQPADRQAGPDQAAKGAQRHRQLMTLARKFTAEALGTAFLLAVVVGSGIMAERLSGGNVAIALLANTLATGAGLIALILTFGPISGAHFNPAVTLADAWAGGRWPGARCRLTSLPRSSARYRVERRRMACSTCRCSSLRSMNAPARRNCGASSSLHSACWR